MSDLEWMDKKEVDRTLSEIRELRKDMSTARGIIQRGLVQYTKRKIGARNKAQVENQEEFFKDLNDYESKTDIQNAYGYDFISENEMDRLMGMWDAREKARENAGKYSDRVTEMLEVAIRRVGDEYIDALCEADDLKRKWDKTVEEHEKAKRQAEYEHKRACMKV